MYFSFYQYSFRENRILLFAGEMGIGPERFQGFKDKLVERQGQTPESPEEAERRTQELSAQTNGALNRYSASFQDFPEDIQNRLKDSLVQFFQSSIDSFDRNGVAGLNLQEFKEYQDNLLKKLEEMLQKSGVTINGATQEAQKKLTEAERKKQEAEDAKRKTELEAKSLEDLQREFRSEMDSLSSLNLDIAALQNPEHAEQMQAQFQKFEQRSQKIQEGQRVLQIQTQKIQDEHGKAQESMKLMSDAANAASAATAVASGAAVGAAIGVWGFGIGALIGAGIGAVVGGLAYGIGKGIAAEALRKDSEEKAKQANERIDAMRSTWNAGKQEVSTAVQGLSQDGASLNLTPETLRRKKQEIQTSHVQEFATRRQETAEARQKRLADILHVQDTQRALQAQRSLLQERQKQIVEGRDKARQTGQSYSLRAEDLQQRGGEIENAVTQIESILPSIQDPQKQKDLRDRLAQLRGTRASSIEGQAALRQGQEQVGGILDTAGSEEGNVRVSLLSTEEYERSLQGALPLLEEALSHLSSHEAILSAVEQDQQKQFESQAVLLTGLDQSISEGILTAELTHATGLNGLEASSKALAALPPVEAPSFGSSIGDGFEGFGQASTFLFGGLAHGIESATGFLKDLVKDIPVLREIVHVVSFPLDVVGGLSEGVGELLNGVSTMLAHPIQTAQGLGALIGLNPDVPAGKAWAELGKALIAYEDFSEGNIGKGTGKVVLNVLLTMTGAGAVGTGARATVMAFNAARSLGSNVAMATVKAAATGAKVAAVEFGSRAAQIPGNLLRGAANILKSPYTITRNFAIGKQAILGEKIAAMGDDLAKVGSQMDDLVKAGKVPAELVGKSSDELAAICKNGQELARLGLTDASSIRGVLQYRSFLQHTEGLQTSLAAAKHTQELLAIDEGLEGLTRAARSTKPEKLQRFVDNFNSRTPPPTAEALGARRFQILESAPDGGFVAFDRHGLLARIPAEDVANFLKEATAASMTATGKPILRILNGANAARIQAARGLVGRMTPAQEKAVLKAHAMELQEGLGGTRPDLQARVKVLKEAGFTDEQIFGAKIRSPDGRTVVHDPTRPGLLRSGITGDSAVMERVLVGEASRTFSNGQSVKVLRSSGAMDEGWSVVGTSSDGGFVVVRKGTGRNAIEKTVPADELAKWNSIEARAAGMEANAVIGTREALRSLREGFRTPADRLAWERAWQTIRNDPHQFPLTKKLLRDERLVPKGVVEIGGERFYVSDIIQTFEGGAEKYRQVVMFVERDGKLVPRVLYKSNSAGGWRSCPGSIGHRYSKGKQIHYTQETQPVDEIIRYLEQQEGRQSLVRYDGDIVKAHFQERDLGNRILTYEDEVMRFNDGGSLRAIQEYQPGSAFRGSTPFTSQELGNMIRSCEELPRGFVPDFNTPPVGVIKRQHPLLGEVTIERYSGTLGGRPVEWHMAYDTQGRIWIEKISLTDSRINSYGIRSEVIDSGLLTNKPFEYDIQAGRLMRGNPPLAVTVSDPRAAGYVDITPFLDRLPPIQRFRQARGIQRGVAGLAAAA